MPQFLATYDLKETATKPHAAVRDAAVQSGWFLWVLASNGLKYKLPNTTLDGIFDNYASAQQAFDLAIRRAAAKVGPIDVEKWVIVEYTNSHFNSDKRLSA